MFSDPWLHRWLPLVLESNGAAPVLEIGCGMGDDTVTLVGAGLTVTAFDKALTGVVATRLRAPAATVECCDIRDPFPMAEGSAGCVVASLTLHYFPWAQTLDLVDRVRSTLQPGGIFLCRLNSTHDKHFGACGHAVIEPNYYLVDGQPKRFFDEASVDQLFERGWQVLSKEHRVTTKYIHQKALWEVVLRRSDT